MFNFEVIPGTGDRASVETGIIKLGTHVYVYSRLVLEGRIFNIYTDIQDIDRNSSSLNILKSWKNGHRSAVGIVQFILWYQNWSILMQILLKFVSKFPIDHKPALVQIMDC